jgi:hypothetical protein
VLDSAVLESAVFDNAVVTGKSPNMVLKSVSGTSTCEVDDAMSELGLMAEDPFCVS